MKKVAILGYGWVGKAMHTMFPEAVIYDPMLGFTSTKDDVNKCDVAFICVPTPNAKYGKKAEGKLDTSIVAECISWLKTDLIVIRSTINPGDSQMYEGMFGHSLVVQPEYLGETVNHPMTDQKNRPFMVIGGAFKDRKKLIDLYTTVYNANITIKQVNGYGAEIIKLTENRAIAFKVAQCQELYDVCEKANVDYYTVRDAVYGDDPRFNLWFTFVYPDNRGMNSKCIPKDVYAWCAWAESLGASASLTRDLLKKNKEWLKKNKPAKPPAKKTFKKTKKKERVTPFCASCGGKRKHTIECESVEAGSK